MNPVRPFRDFERGPTVCLRLETPSPGIAISPLRALPVSKNDGLRAIPATTAVITFTRAHPAWLHEFERRKRDNFSVEPFYTSARRSNFSDFTVPASTVSI